MSIWTKSDDQLLREQAAVGTSAKDIGANLNRSRNSVLGRAWRLGISMHGEPKPRGKPRLASARGPKLRVAKRKLLPRIDVTPQPVFKVPSEIKPVSLLELEEGRCKWPVGDLFCGASAIAPRKPYCAAHASAGRYQAVAG